MRIGILSESKVDETAYKILVEGILDKPVEIIKSYRKRGGGWIAAKNQVIPIIRDLHRTDADGFVFVADSDSTLPHNSAHEDQSDGNPDCRLCQIKKLVENILGTLPARAGRAPLKVAIGMATPAIEAWLLSGIERNCTEAWFREEQSKGRLSGQARRDLKIKKYGSLQASANIRMLRTLENANRIAEDLDALEQRFQFGFGHLRKSLAEWL
ncbi:MAG: hypothetical protein IH984_01340 [Planctomycetes bacterium]|nr:hypothetical protein [Planctomycetota bacterium]